MDGDLPAAQGTARRRRLILAVASLYLVGVGLLVFWPVNLTQPVQASLADVIGPIAASNVEFAANVLLFVPAGSLGALLFARGRRWLVIVLGIGVSIAIETTQAALLVERVPSVRDMVANSLGAVIGVAIVSIVEARQCANPVSAERARTNQAE